MKNMKVKMKLIVSFAIVVALAIIVGGVGIYGMYSINAADDALYNGNYLPTVMADDISQKIVEQRVHIRNFVIYDSDEAAFKSSETSLTTSRNDLTSLMSEYAKSIVNPADQAAFDEFSSAYNKEWIPIVDELYALGAANRTEEAKVALTEASQIAGRLDDLTDTLKSVNLSDGQTAVNGNTTLFTTMTIIEAVCLIVAVAATVILVFYISGLISKPLTVLTAFMNKAGTTGDIALRPEDVDTIGKYSQVKDEVGQCLNSTSNFIKHLTAISRDLEVVANGDLSINISLLSEKDTMGVSMHKMLENLNNMFSEINASTGQVAIGSKQIADGAQSLAQGSTEQAAAVQQLSSSISEIAEKTMVNAEMAGKAAKLADTIKGNAEKGSRQMDEMTVAVREINEASQSISKVISVIDNIAFQTNILALNAAVEAARAGQHGKGFAVVAEEVRSLAAKSAEAARDTGGLIANSMEKAELGTRIAGETAASLIDIVAGINESSQLVGDIAKSSEEQSVGISQINKGIDQVAQVVQQNSATAQESAAASEEMSGQADMLENLIAQFKLKDSGANRYQSLPSGGGHKSLGGHDRSSGSSQGGGYGKY